MLKRLFHIVLVLLLLSACGGREAQRMLERAEAVMNESPSEAIALLDSISDEGLSRSQQMRRLLLLTNAQNKCDTVFRSDSIQRLLVAYYDRHGSANERMLAHYLLGRTYYEAGETPLALECYQEAAECADTISKDCDYKQLSRVYAQMAEILYKQQLYREQMKYERKAARYAWKGKDTLSALMCYEQEYIAYKKLGLTDSAVFIIENVASLYDKYGYPSDAAISLGTIVLTLIEKGEYSKASEYMKRYEKESGYFDNKGNIIKGHEYYYKVKGLYCLRNAKLDSAEYFFRKELRNGQDFNNQNAGAEGLAQLYKVLNVPDSVAKYIGYAYAMNDSMYAQMATETIGRMNAMYDYTYHKRLAEQKENEAYRNRNAAIIFGMLLMLCLLAVYIIVLHIRRYKGEVDERERLLHSRLAELEQQLTIKEIRDVEQEILASPLVNSFRMMAKTSVKKPTHEEWSQLHSFLRDKLPAFWNKLQKSEPPLRKEEVDVCLLIRLQFPVKEIANLTGMSIQAISNVRRRLLQRVFHQSEGGSKEFDRLIMKL